MQTKKSGIRRIVQIFFFGLVALIAVNHTLAESGGGIPFISNASLHAICPFGGVETFYQLMTTGDFIKKIHSSSLILFGIVAALSVVFGPVFCGWICPLGSVTEWIRGLGRKMGIKGIVIPAKVDKYLRYFRYVVLVQVLFVTARSAQLMFLNIDPFHALFQFWTGEVAISALIFTVILLIISLFIERPWCKYMCPFGALLGVTNTFRLFKIRRNAATCVDCKKCDKSCPMDIEVSTKSAVLNHQCISCYQCTSEVNCPVQGTVALSLGKYGEVSDED